MMAIWTTAGTSSGVQDHSETPIEILNWGTILQRCVGGHEPPEEPSRPGHHYLGPRPSPPRSETLWARLARFLWWLI